MSPPDRRENYIRHVSLDKEISITFSKSSGCADSGPADSTWTHWPAALISDSVALNQTLTRTIGGYSASCRVPLYSTGFAGIHFFLLRRDGQAELVG